MNKTIKLVVTFEVEVPENCEAHSLNLCDINNLKFSILDITDKKHVVDTVTDFNILIRREL